MYGVVLLVAMSTSGEVTEAHRGGHGCSGCYGTTMKGHGRRGGHGCRGGCSGCYGGCYGGGCYGGGCYGGSCYGGGCYGGGCYGGGAVVSGGCYGSGYGGGCSGGGYGGVISGGCYGGAISGGCYGATMGGYGGGVIQGPSQPVYPGTPGTIVPSTPDKGKDKGKDKGIEDEGTETSTRATLVVNLPADAKLKVGEQQTTQTSSRRVFVTPQLTPGKVYSYTLKAEVVRQGEPVTWEETVSVEAGKQSQITLNVPTVGVAGR